MKFLYEEVPKLSNNESDLAIMVTMKTWNHSDFMYKNNILNGLDNTLYYMMCMVQSRVERYYRNL